MSVNNTYKSNQFRRVNVEDIDLNVIEFRPNDPADISSNPQRMWVNTATDSVRYTTDGVTVHDISKGTTTNTNVKDYGAVGDGVTDDTDAFQRALDDVVASEFKRTLFVPKGTYLLSKRGTYKNSWTKLSHAYCLMLTGATNFNIQFDAGAQFTQDVSVLTNMASFLVLSNCKDVRMDDMFAKGFGWISVHILYDNALIFLDECERIHVNRSMIVDCRHNVIATRSKSINVDKAYSRRSAVPFIMGGVNQDYPVPDPTLLNRMGTHVGLYATRDSSVTNCVSYGSCDDGDIGCLGGGCHNLTFTNNKIYNFFLEDLILKKTVNIVGQGLYIDSGVINATVSGNTLEGFYYGIDVKTETQNVIVSNNKVQRCMVGITARRGEADLPTNGTLIEGNIITPNNGNGWHLRMARPFDPDSRGFVQHPVGVWLQDQQGGAVTNNIISNDYNDLLQNWHYVGIYVSNTRNFNLQGKAYVGPTLISGNSAFMEQRMLNNGKAGTSNAEFIIVAGNDGDSIPDPTVDPVLTSSAGGSVAPGVYVVTYAWYNQFGTTMDTAMTNKITVSPGEGTINVTLPAKPANATGARVYIGLEVPDPNDFILKQQGTTSTTTFTHSTPVLTTGTSALNLNTTPWAPVTNVTIMNNSADNHWTNAESAYPNGFMRFLHVEQLIISGITFTDIVKSGDAWFTFEKCRDILIDNVMWRYNNGLCRFDRCLGVTISNTSSWESTAGSSVPYFSFTDTYQVLMQGNKMRRQGSTLADGYWISLSGSNDYYHIANNIIQPVNFNPNAGGAGASPFINGTLDTTTTPIRNIIQDNIVISPTVTWPKY